MPSGGWEGWNETKSNNAHETQFYHSPELPPRHCPKIRWPDGRPSAIPPTMLWPLHAAARDPTMLWPLRTASPAFEEIPIKRWGGFGATPTLG